MEFLGRLLGRKPEHFTLPQERPIKLGNQRLLVSTYLDAGFTRLLEQSDPVQRLIRPEDLERNEQTLQQVARYIAKKKRAFVELTSDDPRDPILAYVLRMIQPELLLGSTIPPEVFQNKIDVTGKVLSDLSIQMGIPPEQIFDLGFLRGRLAGREAIIAIRAAKLDTSAIKALEKDISPQNGIVLVVSSL